MEMNQSHNRPSRLLIVSNRLPFTVVERDGELTIEPSSGGLVSGLAAYLDAVGASGGPTPDYLWAGWPGGTVHETAKPRLKELAQSRFNAYPVFLSKEEMENFYYGFCNSTIWPLFHYFPSYAVYEPEYWETYVRVNRTFCQALMEVIRPDDVIWVHDYQLMLLPGMLREQLPGANIGFFLHIPFPSYEIFRLLPRKWGTALLEGLLGANLVGFHTHDYTRYFLRSVLRILGHEHNMGQILVRDRVVQAETFPMGIDFDRYWHAVSEPRVQAERQALKTKVLAGVKVVLSIDRLDYTKGIINRLKGYRLFLEQHPEWHRKVVLALVVIPSRVGVGRYRETKEHIDELVGRINGEFGGLDWVPIIYQYRSLPFELLVAMYNISDVALVTPLRDGMNLIAKEYIATRTDRTGVLVLSEMAGSARELGEAVIINPNSLEEIADALHTALEMPRHEQMARNEAMQQRLRRYDVVAWAQSFTGDLRSIKQVQQRLKSKLLGPESLDRLVSDYNRADSRLVFLDYDGTLVPFVSDPQAAVPGESRLSEAVARCLFKLMAYKDEYEVARLHLAQDWSAALADEFPDGVRVRYHLHPPVLRALGLRHKLTLPSAWTDRLFRVLVALRRLRGTALDPFGRARVRRVERALITEYQALLDKALVGLGPETYERAVRLASLPDLIRGYEEVKLRSVERFRQEARALGF